jgi:transposase
MARWVIASSELLTPLYNLMEERLLEGGFMQMGETTVQVLKEKNRAASTKSQMWVRARDSTIGPHYRASQISL